MPVPLPVSDGVAESEPVLVGDGVDEAVGATADGSTTNTKFVSVRFHAAPPGAPVADAMTTDGAVKAVDKGAVMGPSVTATTLKSPDVAVVPLYEIVAPSGFYSS